MAVVNFSSTMRSGESEITEHGLSLQDVRSGSGNVNLTSAVYKINLDCEECGNKLQRAVRAFDGVEDCKVDWKTNTATVAFGKVDPLKIGQKLEKKTKKKVQLLSTQSGATTVGGDAKENKAEQKYEEKRKQQQDTVLVLKEEAEVDIKCVCCFPGFLRIKIKPGFAAQKEEGAGDKKDKEGSGTKKEGDGVVKTEVPRNPHTPPATYSYGHYGVPPYFPSPRWTGYGNRYPYPPLPPSPRPQYDDNCSIM